MDDIDHAIIRHMTIDGRATQRELARAVGLSPNAAGARLARLFESGVITGVHAAIDPVSIGRPLAASMDVWLNQRNNDEDFIAFVASDDRIIDAFHLTGPVDYRLEARVASSDDLEDLLKQLRDQADVRQTDSRLILTRLETRVAHPR